MRRLPAGRLPVALLGRHLDDLPHAHRPAGLGQHPRRAHQARWAAWPSARPAWPVSRRSRPWPSRSPWRPSSPQWPPWACWRRLFRRVDDVRRLGAVALHLAPQPLRALDADLLAGREVGRVPAPVAVLAVDPNLDHLVGHLRGVDAADLHFVFFIAWLLINGNHFADAVHRHIPTGAIIPRRHQAEFPPLRSEWPEYSPAEA